jgi:glyceraldehyde-3-phosphate dehydrogenase/erythrose-4-phosphate dehydrogenase
VYGRYGKPVTASGDSLIVDAHRIPVFARRDPAELPWADLGVDLVFECTGAFRREEDLKKHLSAGARVCDLVGAGEDRDGPHCDARRRPGARRRANPGEFTPAAG